MKSRSELGIKPTDIDHEVCDIYGKDQMSYMTLCWWLAKFRSVPQQLEDAARTDKPATTTTKKNIDKICKVFQTDTRFTVIQVPTVCMSCR